MFTENSEHPIIQVTGLNHKTASIAVRETFALSEAEQDSALKRIFESAPVNEALVISTCNRVEFVVSAARHADAREVTAGLTGVMASFCSGRPQQMQEICYHHRERSAVSHVFRVASGLDSLVLGEPQVLGQLKDAYERAKTHGSAKQILHRLFHRAFSVAKAVRTQTAIGRSAVSVCYAAKELAEQIFGDLGSAKLMLIGAGEVGALALKHFSVAGVKEIYIVNKTLARACELAEQYGGVPLALSQLEAHLHQADIVIGASSLPGGGLSLIDAAAVERSLHARSHAPQFFLDLAVPRNFAPEINELSDAFLYNIDDLDQVVKANMSARQLEASQAEEIVDSEVSRFCDWLERKRVEESIRELSLRYKEYEEVEIQKTLRRLNRLGLAADVEHQLRGALEDLAQALLAKTLHQPIASLKQMAPRDPSAIEAFREFFLKKTS